MVMGGFGSTRWFMHTKKVTVEACRILDIHQWIRTKLVQPNVRQTGAWTWADAANVPIAALAYMAVVSAGRAVPARPRWRRLSPPLRETLPAAG